MEALRGLAILLLCQSAGEALTRLAHWGVPGPVLGMLFLLVALAAPALRAPVQAAAEVLLSHLSLLFVPVGVGVITHLDLLRDYGVRLMLVIALSTWAGMAVTTLLVRALVRNPQDARKEGSTDA